MQVQGTNDSSIVSKLSAASKGYFQDRCLKIFVEKQQNRSPIINRGYYIRFKAMEAAFNSWIDAVSAYKKSQIVSLGAGFDSSYFRLKTLDQLPLGCKYVEIDYPEVMMRKLECIKQSEFKNLSDLCTEQAETHSCIVAKSEEYVMLGVDLKDCKKLEECLQDLKIDFNVPTLFLSECALTYMNLKSANDIIQWIQTHFPNSAFVVYEQVEDEDGFSIVMKNHFQTLGCPLRSLKKYKDEDDQHSRYLDMGWSSCSSISMLKFFMEFSEKEKQRIQSLELFDEYEMWHEKCRHYSLMWACQGSILVPDMFKNACNRSVLDNSVERPLNSSYYPTPELLQRFGHQVALLSHTLVVSGGFGQFQKRHQRLGGLTFYDIVTKTCYFISPSDAVDPLGKRMFHSMNKLSNNTLAIIGGRSSPSTAFNTVVTINCNNLLQKPEPEYCFSTNTVAVMPLATWRHSACIVSINHVENIFVFGGCAANNVVTNNCYLLNSETWSFAKIPNQEHTPSARHSHAAACFNDKAVYITGGLSKNEIILSSVHVFSIETYKWSTLNIAGLLPRYSHTSLCYKDSIVLVGGITGISYAPHSIGVINLSTKTALEFELGPRDPEYPLILSNHCCYMNEEKLVITGGGGNCFSFGTHFNKLDITIELSSFHLC